MYSQFMMNVIIFLKSCMNPQYVMSQRCKIMLKILKKLFLNLGFFFRIRSNINKCTCRVGNVAEIAILFKIMAICVRLPYSLVGA